MFEIIKQDFETNSIWSFIVLLKYRLSNRFRHNPFARVVIQIIFHPVFVFLGLNALISPSASIGQNVKLIHRGLGVIISKNAIIGNEVVIYHGVTIGISNPECKRKLIVGNGCVLGARSSIISCRLADNVAVSPNTCVRKDIEDVAVIWNLTDCTVRKNE